MKSQIIRVLIFCIVGSGMPKFIEPIAFAESAPPVLPSVVPSTVPSTEVVKATVLSATPRLVRVNPQNSRTEIFFKDRKESLFLPVGDSHNRALDLIVAAIKSQKDIQFSVESKTKEIHLQSEMTAGVQTSAPVVPPPAAAGSDVAH